jgi:pyrimidine operon attenuation protein/uracil phosphoribosyltransferase
VNRTHNETAAVRILDADAIRRALRRMAHEIVERNRDLSALVLAGIPARGVALAERLAADIEAIDAGRGWRPA